MAASALGVERTEITFVSSGTEAVNLALFGAAARLSTDGRILTWAAEHQSVLAAIRRLQASGRDVIVAQVDGEARVDLDAITTGVALVWDGLANNEGGTTQPSGEDAERAPDAGAPVHIDDCAGPRWLPGPDGAEPGSGRRHRWGGC